MTIGLLINLDPALVALVLMGLLSGIYHGLYNNNIYHNSLKSKVPESKNLHERVHIIWIHTVCGVVGSISLYLLFSKHLSNSSEAGLNLTDLILALSGLIAFTGLGPMAIWFTVTSLAEVRLKLTEIVQTKNQNKTN